MSFQSQDENGTFVTVPYPARSASHNRMHNANHPLLAVSAQAFFVFLNNSFAHRVKLGRWDTIDSPAKWLFGCRSILNSFIILNNSTDAHQKMHLKHFPSLAGRLLGLSTLRATSKSHIDEFRQPGLSQNHRGSIQFGEKSTRPNVPEHR